MGIECKMWRIWLIGSITVYSLTVPIKTHTVTCTFISAVAKYFMCKM